MSEINPTQRKIIREFLTEFCAILPGDARLGRYEATAGDGFEKKRYAVPPGRYRVLGSDWLLDFDRGRFVLAQTVAPPDFGGEGVITVMPDEPAQG